MFLYLGYNFLICNRIYSYLFIFAFGTFVTRANGLPVVTVNSHELTSSKYKLSDSIGINAKKQLKKYLPNHKIKYCDSITYPSHSIYDWQIEVQSLKEIANRYYETLNKKLADSMLTKALKIVEQKNDKKEGINIIEQLIKVNSNSVNRKYFLELHYKGKQLAEDLKDKRKVIDFNHKIGTYYFFLKEYKKALSIHLKCLNESRAINYQAGILNGIEEVGSDYYQMNDTLNCIKYFLETEKHIPYVRGKSQEPYIYNCIGTAYDWQHKYDSSIKYYQMAYTFYKKLNNNYGIANSLLSLAISNYGIKKYQLSEQYSIEAMRMAKSIKFLGLIPEILKHLKKTYVAMNNYKKAFDVTELYIRYNDSLAGDILRKQALEKEFAYSIEKKENENKLLEQKNKVQTLQINQNKYFSLVLILVLISVIIVSYTLSKQSKLRALQQSLLLEQKILHVQINPHFISNCLAAIQDLIYSNDYKKATLYLAKFSFFLRQVLNHSEKSLVSLEQEIEIIKLNIELEQLRFNKPFDFELHIDREIDLDEVFIPTLLTQPIIENAIWHGLLPLKGVRDPKLSINVRKRGEFYYVDIIDNGVGRAKESKTESKKHTSKGTNLIVARIAVINKLLKSNNYTFNLYDLIDANGLPVGTKGTFRLSNTQELI